MNATRYKITCTQPECEWWHTVTPTNFADTIDELTRHDRLHNEWRTPFRIPRPWWRRWAMRIRWRRWKVWT